MPSPVVIDAMIAMRLAEHDQFDFSSVELIAPRLMWSESCSVLFRTISRRRADDGPETVMFERIVAAPIRLADDYDRRAPWDIASLLGWHKTYDAEYLAAARYADAGICTLDRRLREGAHRLGIPIVMLG